MDKQIRQIYFSLLNWYPEVEMRYRIDCYVNLASYGFVSFLRKYRRFDEA